MFPISAHPFLARKSSIFVTPSSESVLNNSVNETNLHVNRSLYENLLAEIILLEERYAEKHSAGIPSLPTECYHDFYLFDLDSKKQIRYIADLLFHLCNISLSKLYTDLCNSVAAALDQLLIMGDHENGSAVPRFAFQFFCDQAHILPVKAAGGLIENQYPAAGKDGAGDGKALLLPAGQGGRVRVPVLIKPKLFQ